MGRKNGFHFPYLEVNNNNNNNNNNNILKGLTVREHVWNSIFFIILNYIIIPATLKHPLKNTIPPPRIWLYGTGRDGMVWYSRRASASTLVML
jgi:hypothetical protein